jgi:hypothetical protein
MQNPKFLFIPVSSTEGIGEYTRSLIIALQVKALWPQAEITFVLNKDVKYLANCPFNVVTSNGSPTKDNKTVIDTLCRLKPDLVLFDASGRASQFRKAKALGANVCFISQHKKKRRRGLKLNRLTSIDIHWVAQTDYSIEPLGKLQRRKLKLFSQQAPSNIGTVFAPIKDDAIDDLMQKYQLASHFFVFNAGSGGHKPNGEYSVELLYRAAVRFSEETGIASVVVCGANYPNILPTDMDKNTDVNALVTCIASLSNDEFIRLLINAKGRVISAGDTLLQCIELSLPSVAVSVSRDQPERLKICVDNHLVLSAPLNEQDIVAQAKRLFERDLSVQLIAAMDQFHYGNALTTIVDDMRNLMELS